MILIIHFIATAFMTGVIWVMQLVSYPQLLQVSSADFVEYEKFHMKRISYIVGPMMSLELITAFVLLVKGSIPNDCIQVFYWSLVPGIIIAVSTIVIQAPLHIQLSEEGKIDQKINKLITSNWIRTICWTARTFLIACIIFASS